MLQNSLPPKFTIPWGNNASAPNIRSIPVNSQIGITNGAASLTDGFPPLTFVPESAGGTPPFGADFNGILKQLTQWAQWQSAGGPILYDATFQTAINGYPNGAVVGSLIVSGNYWMSTVDNNVTNPDAGGAGWIVPPGMRGTGEMQHRMLADVIPGWVVLNGTSIGNAASGATQLASSQAQLLFQYLWNGFSNTQCPVSGGRGATALADFNANKTITITAMQGIGVIGVDGMGGVTTGHLVGVPVASGAVTTPGSIVGQNLHTLILSEMASHAHNFSSTTGTMNQSDPHNHGASVSGGVLGSNGSISGTGTGATSALNGATAITVSIGNTSINHNHNYSGSTDAQGGNGSHNNVQFSALVYWYMKL